MPNSKTIFAISALTGVMLLMWKIRIMGLLLSCLITISPVAKLVHLVLVYKVFFLTVCKSIFNADSKSEGSQTKYVERFSKNR